MHKSVMFKMLYQVSVISGSDPANPPGAEQADTFTAGIVWTPELDFTDGLTLTVDYYDIDIQDIIGSFSAQEILDSCYVLGDTTECAKIQRIGGDLTVAGAGIQQFTTNLKYQRAEGIEVGFNIAFDLTDFGQLEFSGTANKYLTQETQSSDTQSVLDCKGYYGTSCDPIAELHGYSGPLGTMKIQRFLYSGGTLTALK